VRDGAATKHFWNELKGSGKLEDFLQPRPWDQCEKDEDKKKTAIFSHYWDISNYPSRSTVKGEDGKTSEDSAMEPKACADIKNKDCNWHEFMKKRICTQENDKYQLWVEFRKFCGTGTTNTMTSQAHIAKYWKVLLLHISEYINNYLIKTCALYVVFKYHGLEKSGWSG
jgi:hypothetical protein